MLRYLSKHGGAVERSVGLKGVIFDMDGTLTLPCIDFDKMKSL